MWWISIWLRPLYRVLIYTRNWSVHLLTGAIPFELVQSKPQPTLFLHSKLSRQARLTGATKGKYIRRLDGAILRAHLCLYASHARQKKELHRSVRETNKSMDQVASSISIFEKCTWTGWNARPKMLMKSCPRMETPLLWIFPESPNALALAELQRHFNRGQYYAAWTQLIPPSRVVRTRKPMWLRRFSTAMLTEAGARFIMSSGTDTMSPICNLRRSY